MCVSYFFGYTWIKSYCSLIAIKNISSSSLKQKLVWPWSLGSRWFEKPHFIITAELCPVKSLNNFEHVFLGQCNEFHLISSSLSFFCSVVWEYKLFFFNFILPCSASSKNWINFEKISDYFNSQECLNRKCNLEIETASK